MWKIFIPEFRFFSRDDTNRVNSICWFKSDCGVTERKKTWSKFWAKTSKLNFKKLNIIIFPEIVPFVEIRQFTQRNS